MFRVQNFRMELNSSNLTSGIFKSGNWRIGCDGADCETGRCLRNRIAMSPMTMYRSTDGLMNDFHLMLLGSRAAGGFGLVFGEQLAIVPEGRTSVSCGGIYDDAQIEGLARINTLIKDMGAVPAIQLGHTGRKGSETRPWEGGEQLAPDHPQGWLVSGPSAIPYGGKYKFPVHELSREEIKILHQRYADAARRALDAVRTRCAAFGLEQSSPGRRGSQGGVRL